MLSIDSKPNDVRNLIHKSRFTRGIVGGVKGFLTGGPIGAFGGAAEGFTSRGRRGGSPGQAVSETSVQRLPGGGPRLNVGPRSFANIRTFAPTAGCIPPFREDPVTGRCKFFIGTGSGPETGPGAFGDATMGRFGAALEPTAETMVHLSCLPGMVLGRDGLCYNRRDISNKDRKWPKGRRPLGTPGELAALSKAASFGRRMETTVKRMQKIGVLKKPSRARRAPTTTHLLGPGPH